jgi:ATP-binding cassette, subfamily C, bacterial
MLALLKIFFRAEGTRPWAVLLCLVLGGAAEALGVGSMVPVLGTMMGGEGQPPSPIETAIRQFLSAIGVTPSFTAFILFIAVVMAFRSLLLFGAMSYAGISGARVTIRLRRRLIRAIFDARWSFYAESSGGRIASAISNDATRAGEAYNLAANSASMFILVAAYAITALFISWRVALLGCAFGILIVLASSRLVRIAKIAGFKQTDRTARLTVEMTDILHGIKALKSMHRYGPLIDGLSVILGRLKRALRTQYFAKYGLYYGNDFLVFSILLLMAWVAHSFTTITLPELTVSGLLFYQIIAYVSKLLKQLQTAVQVEGAHVRLTELIERAESQKEERLGSKTPAIGRGCALHNVTFAHAETEVLHNLSLEIPVNRITVLQGPSGAGKTTLIDLLVGFHRAQSGEVKIGNDRIENIDVLQWRSMLGYVPQELALLHDTVRANITLLDPDITEAQLANALQLSGVDAFLPQLPQGLETDVGEFGGKLSGGQRQRIALARALAKDPKVLILDEVTSALDPETEASIVSNILALRGRYTIIAITHRAAWTKIADRLYLINKGRAKLQTKLTRKKTR